MKQNNNVIAVTGGIGSGKSTALKILGDFGVDVIDCDKITKELYENQEVLKALRTVFPEEITGEKILVADKKRIATKVFNDKNLYKKLTDILVPLIFDKAIEKAKNSSKLCAVEVPLLFEFHYDNQFENIIVINRDKETRIESVCKRSDMTREEVLDRMKMQVDYGTIDDSGRFFLINNDGTYEQLKDRIEKVLETVSKKALKQNDR